MQRGAYVNLVMPPASPTTDSLLRCSVSAAHSNEQIDRIIDAFASLKPDSAQAVN
jgi:8-amino-7-oxononanoate synthase